MFGFSFGTIVFINCWYDKSAPDYYNAEVLGKRISSGKSTTYYIELAPWGPQKKNEEVSVNKNLYNDLEVSDGVDIYYKKGLLNIPWLIIK